ncbi:SOS response-associated peptidase [Paenibacillus senegalensis]|uniref:SOS response-associated peptidase n=1 Tax=Paenibacillus senegalensis TaxID=1465766 RepID=UPI000287DE4E|nr:SOS response-associated peptidase [Paenibacillus senegalensis]
MCGRYSLTVTLEQLLSRFELGNVHFRLEAGYNIAPGQLIPAIIEDNEGNRRIGRLLWGFIPSWTKVPNPKPVINARAETIAEKPSFRESFRRKRCLIPADSFYEWKAADHGKQPMRIMKTNGELFAFAGIYDTWVTPEGERQSSCAIVTTAASSWMDPIHHRMPVILPGPSSEAKWLDRSTPIGHWQDMASMLAEDKWKAYPVSKSIGNVKNNSPSCIEPITQE